MPEPPLQCSCAPLQSEKRGQACSAQGHVLMQVPSCNPKGGFKEVCRFGTTSRGDYICAGNSLGDVRVYDTITGRQVALVSPIKVSSDSSE